MHVVVRVSDQVQAPYFQQRASDQPKRIRTRAALLDSVVAVTARRGLDNINVCTVTREAGLAQGTFYNHFESRNDLIVSAGLAIIDDIGERVLPRVRPLSPGHDRMITALDASIREAVAQPQLGFFLAESISRYRAVFDRIRPRLRSDLRAGARDGGVRADRILEEQVGLLFGLAIRLRLMGKVRRDVNRTTCEAVLRLAGLSVSEAEQLVDRTLTS